MIVSLFKIRQRTAFGVFGNAEFGAIFGEIALFLGDFLAGEILRIIDELEVDDGQFDLLKPLIKGLVKRGVL